MPVKIRQLRAFDAAVRLGSFVEAANALHVSPAALSLTIRELEDYLGFKVLERTTRRQRLTEAGRGYLGFAQRILADLDAADRYVRDVRAGQTVLRIATSPTVIVTLLAQAFQDVHTQFRGIYLQPLDVAANGILDSFITGKADIAVGINLPNDDEFESTRFFESRWFAYVATGDAWGNRSEVNWEELAGRRIYMTKSSNYLRIKAELAPFVDLSDVNDSTAAVGLAMAATGSGVAIFPGYIRSYAKAVGVSAIPLARPVVNHHLDIGIRRQQLTPAPVSAVRDAIMRSVQIHHGALT